MKSTAKKRVQKNTAAGQIETMQSVSDILQPTITLDDLELSHFNRVVTSREASSWSPHDLTIACQLAKSLSRLEQVSGRLDSEGLTLVNDRGTVVAHPLLSASMTMANTIQALTRTLGLGASQRGLAGSQQASRNSADKDARDVIKRAAESDLLA